MSLDDPAVITCAISGAIANREQCPAIPYTPAEYAAEARRIVDEGGVHIHIHARTPDGTPSYEIEDFAAITRRDPSAEIGDAAIINFSTGTIGVPVEKRIAYLRGRAARGGGAEHGLDELREVLAQAQGLRVQVRVREPVRRDHRAAAGDAPARHQARARVLRPRPRRHRSRRSSTWGCSSRRCTPTSSWASSAGCRPTARNLAAMADNMPDGQAPLGRDRNRARAVDAGRAPRSRSAARSASGSRTTSISPTGPWPGPTAS